MMRSRRLKGATRFRLSPQAQPDRPRARPRTTERPRIMMDVHRSHLSSWDRQADALVCAIRPTVGGVIDHSMDEGEH